MVGFHRFIRVTGLVVLIVVGCRTRSDSTAKQSISGSGIEGYAQPGKGFDLLGRKISENICVTGDTGSASDVSGYSSDADTTAHSTPGNENGGTDHSNGSATDTDHHGTSTGSSHPGTVDPAKPHVPPIDPYNGSTFGRGNTPRSLPGAVARQTSRENIDAAVLMPAPSDRPGSSQRVGGDQAGNGEVSLFYLSSTKDVRKAIDATYTDSTAISGTKDGITADVGQTIEGSLNLKFANSNQYTFILLHGLKTYSTLGTDVVTNPVVNSKLNNLLFGATLPTEQSAVVSSYNTFRKICGDYYVESVLRGREVWMVAVMDRQTFLNSMDGKVSVGGHAGISKADVGSVKKDWKTTLGASGSEEFLKQTVQIYAISRGKSDMTVGSFTVEDAMTEFNKFMVASGSEGEGVLELNIRPYNNVRVIVGTTEKRLGDIYTAAVVASVAKDIDVFAKLGQEKTWAAQQSARIWQTYGYDQWSLEDQFYNGVAKQYKAIKSYEAQIADVFSLCGKDSIEQSSANEDCLKAAKAVAAIARPKLNLPTPYPQKLIFYMPDKTRKVADPSLWASSKGQFVQKDARNDCTANGYALPNADNWRRIIEASYFYLKWQTDQNPAYRPDNDANALGYLCGKFPGAYFWGNDPGKVVQINGSCSSNVVSMVNVPKEFQFTSYIFWTKPMSHYACVNFSTADNKN